MKSYKNLYPKLYSYKNLEIAFKKARRNKSFMPYVVKFEKNLEQELKQLQAELRSLTYKPRPLKRFIVRDPKTRTIHSSVFRDRVVYHAIVNILEPIFDKTFIYDSYASRKYRGTLKAVIKFDGLKRKVSKNGVLIKYAYNNNMVRGYVLKADIKHYFETVDHKILLKIIMRKIRDNKVIWIIKQILDNFDTEVKGKSMPLGNLTSQFFANVYLNDFDYFVKHNLKAKHYIRYVDDFVILHPDKEVLKGYKEKMNKYLKNLELGLHPDKSKILLLRNGITFLGYRIFYHYRLLRKSNLRGFERNFREKLNILEASGDEEEYEKLINSLQGWFGYAIWADTYKFRKRLTEKIEEEFPGKISSIEINRYLKLMSKSPHIFH